ncbi:MAG: glycosyltransferase [Bacteroidales bacterium]|nr:glycosyltransferase [Bacteroidales bacterium]
MKPTLLFITNRFVIGGPAFHVADLARRLQSDFDVFIIGGEAALGEMNNLSIFYGLKNEPILLPEFSRRFNLINDFKSYFAIKRYIKELKPLVVHTHTAKPGVLGRYAAYTSKVKVIVHTYHGHLYRGYFNKIVTRLILWTDKRMVRYSSAIIALTNSQKKDLIDFLQIADTEKVRVIFPGIELDRFSFKLKAREKFRKRFHVDDQCLALGIVGRLVEIKNIKLFLRGIKKLKTEGIRVKGIVVGDGPEKRHLKDYCLTLGLTFAEFSVGTQDESVVFTSWQKDLTKVYSGLDGLALTSENEGAPYSLMEAQLVGLPIIASKVGGVEDIVLDGQTGLLFETEESFYTQLILWASNPELRKNLAANSRNFALASFNADRMTAETKKLYESLIPTKAS